ncbi:heavy metal-binding domain-containing protein [Vibrio sinaloensis]|nr:heavy metal-binding domain-containing protein [Vibrio sinaloensis]
MKTLHTATLALLVGGALGFGVNQFYLNQDSAMSDTMAGKSSSSDEPLYWVAPMDPNYQRDKPGKSPMGMDLIPVYAEDLAGEKQQPGTVSISPTVEKQSRRKDASRHYRATQSTHRNRGLYRV